MKKIDANEVYSIGYWKDLEERYREHLSRKYVAYMSYASGYELMLLAALVDGDSKRFESKKVRTGYRKGVHVGDTTMSIPPKRYSTYTREEAHEDILSEIDNAWYPVEGDK